MACTVGAAKICIKNSVRANSRRPIGEF